MPSNRPQFCRVSAYIYEFLYLHLFTRRVRWTPTRFCLVTLRWLPLRSDMQYTVLLNVRSGSVNLWHEAAVYRWGMHIKPGYERKEQAHFLEHVWQLTCWVVGWSCFVKHSCHASKVTKQFFFKDGMSLACFLVAGKLHSSARQIFLLQFLSHGGASKSRKIIQVNHKTVEIVISNVPCTFQETHTKQAQQRKNYPPPKKKLAR